MTIVNQELDIFLKLVYTSYGHDFIHYNYSTLKRRIENHCISLNINCFEQYRELILSSKSDFDDMFSYFSINVTEFFREPSQLKIFREKVVPYLKSFPHINIWCAGCSSGESPYSLSILLEEEGLLDKSQIYATDFNNRILAHAKDGLFDISDSNISGMNYKLSGGKKTFQEYFVKKGKFYQIKKRFKQQVLFFNHNLATDGIMNEFQVIICKNVMIYFDNELKQRVINLFDNSLECNGFLILGQSEYLLDSFKERFPLYIPKSKIYHKKC